MSITTTVKNRLVDAMNMAFAAIGKTVETKMPRLKKGDNRAGIAWEYFLSSHVLALARAREADAKKAAISAGVLFDHEKHPREPGDGGVIYMGEQVIVTLTVSKPSTTVNATRMGDWLINNGVSAELVDAATKYATTKNRPAHSFKASLAVSDPDK